MNHVKTAITKVRKTKAAWPNPDSFAAHLLEDIQHRLDTVRIRCSDEERRALRDAADDINFAIVRETTQGQADVRVLTADLRNHPDRFDMSSRPSLP